MGEGSGDAATRRESQYINKSLTFLEQVVVALTSKSRSHIPYRQTKLTSFLRDSLGGNCRTLMLACIWAESRHLEETISTLQLAQRMMKVNFFRIVKKYQNQLRSKKNSVYRSKTEAELTKCRTLKCLSKNTSG